MSLSCECGEWDGEGVAWLPPEDYTTLTTKRRQRCRSCKSLIAIGETCASFHRFRAPQTDIEQRIYGEDSEVHMAPWYFCETCADLYFSIDALGYCIALGDDMRELVKEYADQKQWEVEQKRKALA